MATKRDAEEAQDLLFKAIGTIAKGIFGMVGSMVTKKNSFTDEYYKMTENAQDVEAEIEEYKARLADDYNEGYESAKGMSDTQLRTEIQKAAKAGMHSRAKGMKAQYDERHE